MRRVAFFDCFSGISGDMCLGAIIDAGVPLETLSKQLKKLPVSGYRLSSKRVKRSSLQATKVDVRIEPGHTDPAVTTWKEVSKIIEMSSLPELFKRKGLSVFKTLFDAEAKVHGGTFRTVHLHEIGAVDCMIDIFGTIIGLHVLGVDEVVSSPVNLGSGIVKTTHGLLPVPAPATAAILHDYPVYSRHVRSELTTPTGAALIKELSSRHGDVPLMRVEKVGIGAGARDYKNWPNVLRLFVGTPLPPDPIGHEERGEKTVTVIETNIDDMNPQIYEHLIDMLFRAGSLDVSLTHLIMKKGRPGVRLTVLCDDRRKDAVMKIILRETSSIGLRYYETKRKIMEREMKYVNTEFGKVHFKISRLGNEIIKAVPEFEDCKKIARRLHIPLIEVLKKIQQQESP